MNRLSFAKKFLVIGGLSALSTGTLLALYLDETTTGLRDAHRALVGIELASKTQALLTYYARWSQADLRLAMGDDDATQERRQLDSKIAELLADVAHELAQVTAIRDDPEDLQGHIQKTWASLSSTPGKMSSAVLQERLNKHYKMYQLFGRLHFNVGIGFGLTSHSHSEQDGYIDILFKYGPAIVASLTPRANMT
jgi:hypothetical protein